MSLFGSVGLLAPLAIALPIAAGAVAANARRAANRTRSHELRESVGLLKIHCDAMELLDDDAVPDTLIAFAVNLSGTLHEPRVRDTVHAAIRVQRSDPSPSSAAALARFDAIKNDYEHLLATRPDLATAFIKCIVSGVLAFEKRWPDCAGVLGAGLSEIVSAPIERAQRIVSASRGADTDWRLPPVEPIAA